MNEKIGEQISALLDDELDQHENDLLFKRIEQDEDLQNTLTRYQLIGDIMRNEHEIVPSSEFMQGIHDKLDTEPAIVSASRQSKSWLRPVAGLAIAASVATFSIIGIQQISTTEQQPTLVPTLAQQTPASQGIRRVSGTNWNMQQPEMEQRLNSYLVNHSEYASSTSLQGIINYARIAGYDAQRKNK